MDGKRAAVRTHSGRTRHRIASEAGIQEVPPEAIKTVEIVPTGDGAWFLLRYDEAGLCRADTWHQSVEQAKECAREEYGITDADWVE